MRHPNIYDKFKQFAEEVKIDYGKNLDKLQELHDKISYDIEETKKEIERINLTTILKGRCRYL